MTNSEKAVALHKDKNKHRNCAQCVLLASNDLLQLPEDLLDKIGAGLGGGMAAGENCGALTGAVIALGLLGKQKEARKLVDAFKSEYRSCLCRQLKKKYKVPCDDLIALGAGLVEEIGKNGTV